MLDHSLCKDLLSNIQPKPPLAELETMPSCPIADCLGEKTDPHLATISSQVVVESDEIFPESSLLQDLARLVLVLLSTKIRWAPPGLKNHFLLTLLALGKHHEDGKPLFQPCMANALILIPRKLHLWSSEKG
ncbi:hypothetical protein BTVI_82478 [Pitangus sulphuratus]|nr:hypothetical protein BTVI_82478 [Pitangus sulphuratus]